MTDLKPCPFCGHYAYVTYWGKILFAVNSEKGDCYTASCSKCDASISAESEDEVVKRWNNRITTPKKMCANCKHWGVGYDGLGDCSKSSLGIVYYKESCDKWESI